MHAILSYRGNRPTNKHKYTHTQTHRQDRLQYTSAQCNDNQSQQSLYAVDGSVGRILRRHEGLLSERLSGWSGTSRLDLRCVYTRSQFAFSTLHALRSLYEIDLQVSIVMGFGRVYQLKLLHMARQK